jgi:hypothetical protein
MWFIDLFRPFASAIIYKHNVKKKIAAEMQAKYPDADPDGIDIVAGIEAERVLDPTSDWKQAYRQDPQQVKGCGMAVLIVALAIIGYAILTGVWKAIFGG